MAVVGRRDGELVEDNRRPWDERVPIDMDSAFYWRGVSAGQDDLDDYQLVH